jgi:Fe-S cluster assembly protein SufD
MNVQGAEETKYSDTLAALPLKAAWKDHAWIGEKRQAALARFLALGIPTRKNDDWKYVDLGPVMAADYAEACDDCLERADKKVLELYFLSHAEKNRMVFVNGYYSKKFSSVKELPRGVVLEDLRTAARDHAELVRPYLAKNIATEKNALAAVNAFHFDDGLFLCVPSNVEFKTPVHVLHVNVGQGGEPIVFYPRVLVVLGAGASASVVVNHVELSREEHLMNAASEFYLGENAKLDLVSIQRAENHGSHFYADRFELERGARADATFVVRGGGLTRTDASADLKGEGAEASFKGLSILSGSSKAYANAAANHLVPRCSSRQYYKNVVAEEAKAEFASLVFVEKGAVKSDSKQLSRNILLSETAQAFARPQLQILNDDVACAHGATVGQLDKDELFYLTSRGLSKDVARYLLIYGFAEEIIDEIADPTLKAQLEEMVRLELERLVKTR